MANVIRDFTRVCHSTHTIFDSHLRSSLTFQWSILCSDCNSSIPSPNRKSHRCCIGPHKSRQVLSYTAYVRNYQLLHICNSGYFVNSWHLCQRWGILAYGRVYLPWVRLSTLEWEQLVVKEMIETTFYFEIYLSTASIIGGRCRKVFYSLLYVSSASDLLQSNQSSQHCNIEYIRLQTSNQWSYLLTNVKPKVHLVTTNLS